MAVLSNDVLHFLEWLPSYLRTCGDRRNTPVTLDDLSNCHLGGYGFLTGAVEAYKRHLNPPPPPRPIEQVLTTDDLALLKRQSEEVQGCLVDALQRLDPGEGKKADSEAVRSLIEFIAGPQLVA